MTVNVTHIFCNQFCIRCIGKQSLDVLGSLFSGKNFALDLAGAVVGILTKKEMVVGKSIKSGDIIIGVKSSGLHSNGYTLARNVLLSKYKLNSRIKGIGHLAASYKFSTNLNFIKFKS